VVIVVQRTCRHNEYPKEERQHHSVGCQVCGADVSLARDNRKYAIEKIEKNRKGHSEYITIEFCTKKISSYAMHFPLHATSR
jgi:hypothetical protein